MGSNRFLGLILLASVCFSPTTWVPAEGSAGSDLLDEKEGQVTFLKNKVEENHRRRCEFLRSCGAPPNCSRHSCWPVELDDTETYLTCKKVVSNAYCPHCDSKYFDFTRSYVRLAQTTDIASTDTAVTICSQRVLDAAFKAVCNKSSHSRAFLGTVDGTYIHYPGSDRSKDECYNYDPRFRPWYIAATSIQKAVMVLVDGGPALGSHLPAPLSETFLNLTYDIVTDLLNTLSEKDVVNIITYDSSSAAPLASSPVQVVYNNAAGSTSHSEFDELKGKLLNAKSSGGSSNINFGIKEALDNYAPNGVPKYDTYMKIIIVFTDGNIASFQNSLLTGLKGQKVKVCVFKLPVAATPPSSVFLTQLQSLGGSYNAITSLPSEVKNRLLSILPYFSFLAKFGASLNDSADYSLIYEDFEHVLGNIFSITKPAFADDGRLLGIVGLNIFVDELPEKIAKSVNDSLPGRTVGKAFDPLKFVLGVANASIQNGTIPAPCIGSGIPSPSDINGGLCAQNDRDRRSIQDLTCCGACSSGTNSKLKYIGTGLGVAVVTVLTVLIVCFFLRRKRRSRETVEFEFKEDADQPALGTSQTE